ncbi:unnamed protein product [Linum tenue]|uniref:Uncharacterized protein n=1 Tax=Linum tenue TaxID=586396 RepID=A0AAV0MH43_9ROSI|nr:unnamed protein product [Linum tenue]
MDANICDMNHLDANEVLLPPRKRLLTGYKKRAFDSADPHTGTLANANASAAAGLSSTASPYSQSSSSPLVSPPPSPSATRFQTHLSDILSSHFNDNLTPEEIVTASRTAADAAVKAAEEARAVAQDKAAMAAKAVAAAKEALAMVASFSEKEKRVVENRETIRFRKKKLKKKHVQVQVLYNKKDQQPIMAGGAIKSFPASAGCIEL